MKWLANVWHMVNAQKYRLNTDVPMPFCVAKIRKWKLNMGAELQNFRSRKHENSAIES